MDKLTNDLLTANHIKANEIHSITSSNENAVVIQELLNSNVLQEELLYNFIVENMRSGKYDFSILSEHPFLCEESVLQKLATNLNIDFVDIDTIHIDYSLSEHTAVSQLKRFNALALYQDDLSVTVAFSDPLDIHAQEGMQRFFPRKPLRRAVCTSTQINEYLNKLEIKDSIKELVQQIRNELKSNVFVDDNEASSILKLIDLILKSAILSRGSDIHIEPTKTSCIVRTRVDGQLSESFIFDHDIFAPLASRLKLLSNLDIAEKRKPQDGRFSKVINEKEFDFRISTLPIMHGESIVMRILDKTKAMVKLEDAGMDEISYKKFTKALTTPHGIILVTGPTGSGKTTTLYGALNELRNTTDKIITVEDPIEYQMNLIQQVQVKNQVGLTFASALRSILRQDPDKIMIGEIRDKETLQIAIQAALTGHLVLSTLHTNDAISAIARMIDMGIAPYLISGSIIAVEAQRLVRKICLHCKEEINVPSNVRDMISSTLNESSKFYKGKGCKECNETGYIGREMICEVLPISETIASLIAKEATKEEIATQAKEEDYETIFQNGLRKVVEGKTTIEELLRVARL